MSYMSPARRSEIAYIKKLIDDCEFVWAKREIEKITLFSFDEELRLLHEEVLELLRFNVQNKVLRGYCYRMYDDVKIPNGIIEIADNAFTDFPIRSLTVPPSVKRIGKCAFKLCRELCEVRLSSGLVEIDEFAFSDCTALKTIIIPKTVKRINGHAFFGSGIVRASVPEGVVLGPKAFDSTPMSGSRK